MKTKQNTLSEMKHDIHHEYGDPKYKYRVMMYKNIPYTIKIFLDKKKQNMYCNELKNIQYIPVLTELSVGDCLPVLYNKKLDKTIVLNVVFEMTTWNDLKTLVNTIENNNINVKRVYIIQGDIQKKKIITNCDKMVSKLCTHGYLVEQTKSIKQTIQVIDEYVEMLSDELWFGNKQESMYLDENGLCNVFEFSFILSIFVTNYKGDEVNVKQFNQMFIKPKPKNIQNVFELILSTILQDEIKLANLTYALKKKKICTINGLQQLYDTETREGGALLIYNICKNALKDCGNVEKALIKMVNDKDKLQIITKQDSKNIFNFFRKDVVKTF